MLLSTVVLAVAVAMYTTKVDFGKPHTRLLYATDGPERVQTIGTMTSLIGIAQPQKKGRIGGQM